MRSVIAMVLLAMVPLVRAGESPRVVMEKDLPASWVADPAHKMQPRYPGELLGQAASGCAAVPVVIREDGSVELRGKPVSRMASGRNARNRVILETAAVDSVKPMRFDPAAGNAARVPVLTYFTLTYSAGDHPPSQESLTALCVLPDFPAGYEHD